MEKILKLSIILFLSLSDASGLGYTLLNGLDTKFVAPNKFHGDFHLAYGQKIEIVLIPPQGVLAPTIPTYLQ